MIGIIWREKKNSSKRGSFIYRVRKSDKVCGFS